MSLRLGDTAPDFEQDSSAGTIKFHEWLGNSWGVLFSHCLLYTSPSPRDGLLSRMPSSA